VKDAGQIWKGKLADYWLDEDGVLHAASKVAARTTENVKANFDLVHQITHNQQVCVILDMTHTKPYSVNALRHLLAEFRYAYKAIAFVSRSPIGEMVANIAIELNRSNCPMRVFKNSEDAKEWIRKYL
jgi:hypothetical protein